MPDAALVDRIAPELGQLEHPGDAKHEPRPIVLPIFRHNAVPPEMRDQFAYDAGLPTSDINRLVVEAIIALIEQTHQLVPNAEATAMRQAVTENLARQRQLGAVCRPCGNPLFRVNVDVENPKVELLEGPLLPSVRVWVPPGPRHPATFSGLRDATKSNASSVQRRLTQLADTLTAIQIAGG